jgi:hypothetical protein
MSVGPAAATSPTTCPHCSATWSIAPEDIKVNLERQDNLDVLEVKIELPEKA